MSETNGNNTRMRVTHRFEFLNGLLPRMHQMSNYRYTRKLTSPTDCLRLKAPKRHRKNLCFLSICFCLIRPSVVIKEVKHIEMSKAAPKKSICHFQKLEMILK